MTDRAPLKFTESEIAKYKGPPTDHIKWDATMPGFGIRIHAGGAIKSYCVMYRVGKKQRKMTLGRVGKVTLSQARDYARDIFAQAKRGTDAANVRGNAAADASETFAPTYKSFLEFLKVNKRAESYVQENERYLSVHLKRLHPLALTSITRKTVAVELQKIAAERGPIAANRCKAAGSAFYSWMMTAGSDYNNPFYKTITNSETKRQRTLTEREIKAIWNGVGHNQFGDIVKLLMLTMQRRDEIGALHISEINLDKRQLEIDGTRIKNSVSNKVPLSGPALAIVEARYDTERRFLFGRYNNPFSGWSKAKEELDAALKTINNPWVLHDLRRTGKTIMSGELDIPREITEAILNHVKPGLEGVYNTADYARQKRDALDKYAAYLMGIVG